MLAGALLRWGRPRCSSRAAAASLLGSPMPDPSAHTYVTSSEVTSEKSVGLELQQQIGFIGVGNMGGPMAANLLKAGLPVLVFDRNPAAVEKLQRLGAQVADSPMQIGQTPGVTAVISMLPSTEHVADAFEGPQGLLKGPGGLQPSLLIDCSTILPTYSRKLAASVATYSLLAPNARRVPGSERPVFVDAPVSGGVPGAVAGTLTFMCGGSELGVRAARPLLGLLGRSVQHLGEAGAGQVAKICNNLAMAVQMAGLSEALALGAAMGLDPGKLTSVINTSSARCWASEQYNPAPGVMPDVPSARGYVGGFGAALMAKDLRIAMQLAAGASQPLPMGEKAALLYRQVLDVAPGPVDFSAIYELVYHGKPAGGSSPAGGGGGPANSSRGASSS